MICLVKLARKKSVEIWRNAQIVHILALLLIYHDVHHVRYHGCSEIICRIEKLCKNGKRHLQYTINFIRYFYYSSFRAHNFLDMMVLMALTCRDIFHHPRAKLNTILVHALLSNHIEIANQSFYVLFGELAQIMTASITLSVKSQSQRMMPL